MRIVDIVPLGVLGQGVVAAAFVVLEISYEDGEPELYAMPIAQAMETPDPRSIIGWLEGPPDQGNRALVDGLAAGTAASALLGVVADGGLRHGASGVLRGEPSAERGSLDEARTAAAQISSAEQSNSSVTFGQHALLKIYRHLVEGPNTELEVGRFLSVHPHHPPTPRVLGALTHLDADGAERSVGIVDELVLNDGDAWAVTQRELRAQFQHMQREPSEEAVATAGRFPALASTLGRRTAELHLGLADVAAGGDPAFTPEPFTTDDRAAAARGVEKAMDRVLATLGERRERLSRELWPVVARLLDSASPERKQIASLLTRFRETPIAVVKTRVHGDLHLGRVLARKDDFMIIDFEGEPSRPLAERRAKSSPLRDVVGMTRSFDYAPAAALRAEREGAEARGDAGRFVSWAARWKREVTETFERVYFETAAGAPFVPPDATHLRLMLDFYAVERVIYEMSYESDNRPDWLGIPLDGLETVLSANRGAP